jgi:hypothetical protein
MTYSANCIQKVLFRQWNNLKNIVLAVHVVNYKLDGCSVNWIRWSEWDIKEGDREWQLAWKKFRLQIFAAALNGKLNNSARQQIATPHTRTPEASLEQCLQHQFTSECLALCNCCNLQSDEEPEKHKHPQRRRLHLALATESTVCLHKDLPHIRGCLSDEQGEQQGQKSSFKKLMQMDA